MINSYFHTLVFEQLKKQNKTHEKQDVIFLSFSCDGR